MSAPQPLKSEPANLQKKNANSPKATTIVVHFPDFIADQRWFAEI